MIEMGPPALYGFSLCVRLSVCLSHTWSTPTCFNIIEMHFALYDRAMLDACSLSAVAELLVSAHILGAVCLIPFAHYIIYINFYLIPFCNLLCFILYHVLSDWCCNDCFVLGIRRSAALAILPAFFGEKLDHWIQWKVVMCISCTVMFTHVWPNLFIFGNFHSSFCQCDALYRARPFLYVSLSV